MNWIDEFESIDLSRPLNPEAFIRSLVDLSKVPVRLADVYQVFEMFNKMLGRSIWEVIELSVDILSTLRYTTDVVPIYFIDSWRQTNLNV